MKRLLAQWHEHAYAVLRIVTGFLFTWHGVQKVFGGFGKSAIHFNADPQIWLGGLIELACGVAIAAGLFTRWAAFLASGTMAVAYFQYHLGADFSASHLLPIVNKGELAVVYAVVFLLIATRGPGCASVDRVLKRDE